MDAEAGVPERITGRRPVMSRRTDLVGRVLLAAYFVGGIVLLIMGKSNGLTFVGLAVVFGVMRFRPATVVDRNGIRRPWRKVSRLSWSEVDSVMAPEPGIVAVRVRTGSGSIVSLHDVPVHESAAVAAIGGVPISRVPTPVAPLRSPTERELSFDLDRRVQAFDERSRILDAEYRRIRGGRPDV